MTWNKATQLAAECTRRGWNVKVARRGGRLRVVAVKKVTARGAP